MFHLPPYNYDSNRNVLSREKPVWRIPLRGFGGKRYLREDMKKRQITLIALWGITIAWTVFCLVLSWQTGEQTGAFSLNIAKRLIKVLGAIGVHAELNALHMAIRKSAHVGLFFIVGFLTWLSAMPMAKGRVTRNGFPIVLAILSLFAEIPKYWIPGRHLTWSEAFLNVAGVLSGYFLPYLITELFKKRRAKTE